MRIVGSQPGQCGSVLLLFAWLVAAPVCGQGPTSIGGGEANSDTLAAEMDSDLAKRLWWELGTTGTRASLRGLSAPTDLVVWASGSGGTVIRSMDGGSSWIECGPTDWSGLDFRSIHAWDLKTACIASAGTPAVILRTSDGGETWQEAYRGESKGIFLNAIRFWNRQTGLAFGDPVGGKLHILRSVDGGRSWETESSLPPALEGEAGFAASNSALCLGRPLPNAWIGTGGVSASESRVYIRDARQSTWKVSACPLPSGPTQGIFSVAQGSGGTLVAVGGDYRADVQTRPAAATSSDGGFTWQLAESAPPAYRSAVIAWPNSQLSETFVATGPTGSDVSAGGSRWRTFSNQGFHALAASPTQVFAVGPEGRLAVLKQRPN